MAGRGEEPPEHDDDLPALAHPLMQAAVLIWTLGIFGIAIVLAYAGQVLLGLLVLAAGLAVGLFAFWKPLVELWRYWRDHHPRT